MSLSWRSRKERLNVLLKSFGDEDADGIALDRLMHGQNIIGKTEKTREIDDLRFRDKDLDVVGTLEHGQFGVIHLVTCRPNGRVYVRKSIEKHFALRARDQCFPQFERDILLQALKTTSPWAPHLLCAFQSTTHLNLVMNYAEGGTLWDVLESSPHDGRILEHDLNWWTPQIVSALNWCHSQGFAHRDVKPHNFVITSNAHLLLIDFGSAAPLLPPKPDGTRLLPKRYCLLPCGTCDYISPEILKAHEEALVALEMDSDDEDIQPAKHLIKEEEETGYGVETDWWSVGAMLYEMTFGVAPFFANDIRQTYLRIINHERSLKFDRSIAVSKEYQHFISRLLTGAVKRLGRRGIDEVMDHPLFSRVDWRTLHEQPPPPNIHLPQFVYSEPRPGPMAEDSIQDSESLSQGFAFSAFFQSSTASGHSVLRPSPMPAAKSRSVLDESAAFIGFSWGPPMDAFPEEICNVTGNHAEPVHSTPLLQSTRYLAHSSTLQSPPSLFPFSLPTPNAILSTPLRPFTTMAGAASTPFATLPRTRTDTVRRTLPRRNVSDREAMKQMVDCIGMSARKKVLESGRKPRVLSLGDLGHTNRPTGSWKVKELRFDVGSASPTEPTTTNMSGGLLQRPKKSSKASFDLSISGIEMMSDQEEGRPPRTVMTDTDVETETESEVNYPPSPSPSPRPGSAMSMFSRRSGTPTASLSNIADGRLRLNRYVAQRTHSRTGSGSSLPGAFFNPSLTPPPVRIKLEESDFHQNLRWDDQPRRARAATVGDGSDGLAVPVVDNRPPPAVVKADSAPNVLKDTSPKQPRAARRRAQSDAITRSVSSEDRRRVERLEERYKNLMTDISTLEEKLEDAMGQLLPFTKK